MVQAYAQGMKIEWTLSYPAKFGRPAGEWRECVGSTDFSDPDYTYRIALSNFTDKPAEKSQLPPAETNTSLRYAFYVFAKKLIRPAKFTDLHVSDGMLEDVVDEVCGESSTWNEVSPRKIIAASINAYLMDREPLTDEERKVVDRSWERFKATVQKQDELKQESAVKEVMEPGLCVEGGEP